MAAFLSKHMVGITEFYALGDRRMYLPPELVEQIGPWKGEILKAQPGIDGTTGPIVMREI